MARSGRGGGVAGDRMGSPIARVVANVRSRVANLESCRRLIRAAVREPRRVMVPTDQLHDHAPIYYAVHLWNALAERGDVAQVRGRPRSVPTPSMYSES